MGFPHNLRRDDRNGGRQIRDRCNSDPLAALPAPGWGHSRGVARSILVGLVVLYGSGCGGNPATQLPDACPPDGCVVPPDACRADAGCGPIDAPVDGPIDGPIDGPVDTTCPTRTQPAGVPERPYASNEIHLGDVVVTGAAEVAALAGIKQLSGDLTIGAPIASVSLPDLEVITGDLVTSSTTIVAIALPRLETVGGRIDGRVAPGSGPLNRWSTPQLVSVGTFVALSTREAELSCLFSVPASLVLSRVLRPIVLPRLGDVVTASFQSVDTTSIDLPVFRGDALEVYDSPQLTTLRVAGPRTIDLRNDPMLSAITLQPGADTRFVDIDGLHSLATLDFLGNAPALIGLAVRGADQLRSVAGAAQPGLAELTITDAPQLEALGAVDKSAITGDLVLQRTGLVEIDLPNVIDLRARFIGVLSIRNNEVLTSLAMPNLTNLGAAEHFITSNPMLPTAQATAIRDRVKLDDGGTFTIQGNLP